MYCSSISIFGMFDVPFCVCHVTGGRDRVGRPIISLTQPEQGGVEELMEMTEQELFDMLAYFLSVPR